MNYKNTHFIKEFKSLIEKEKKSNKTITGKITDINNNTLKISTKYSHNLSKNISVEVNRVKAIVTSAKNKNIELKIENKNIFKINEEVSIKNIQKDIIIQKLQETYDNIRDNKISEENKETLNIIFGNEKINYVNKKFSVNNLNKNQKEAVKKSLQTDKFHLIQGPPGTGKTHTIVEIIKQLYKMNNKILITTHTHIALDNILERLNDVADEQILRIGQKSQVTSKVTKYTMENQIKQHVMFNEILEKEKLITNLSKKNYKLSPTMNVQDKHENILSKIFSRIFQIKNIENTNDNLVRNEVNVDNTERLNELKLEVENIKQNIQYDILQTTKIFASTVLSSSSYLTKDIDFDYVIMDEASQVPVYLALIPLMKTTKFILIGDNKQLQPIRNNNASYLLNKSIFNLLIDKYPDNFTFLNIQYRMNQEISDIASKLYYDGRLLTGDNVKYQKIILNNHKSFLLDDNPLSIIDTSNINFDESNVSGGCCNKYESEIILNLLSNLKCNGISLDEIGIITPYKKQKLYIQKLLRKNELNVECDTIYRFQGREKDVILVSFCKSSPKSLTKFQKNFLADENQLNVSITRSRKKLILVGNFDMIKSADNIKKLIDRISEENILYLQDIL